MWFPPPQKRRYTQSNNVFLQQHVDIVFFVFFYQHNKHTHIFLFIIFVCYLYNIQLLGCAFCLCEPERTACVSVCVWDGRERVVRTRAWRIPHNTGIFPHFWTRPASSVYTRESTSLDYRVPTLSQPPTTKEGFAPFHPSLSTRFNTSTRQSVVYCGYRPEVWPANTEKFGLLYFFSRVAGLFLSFILSF